MSRYNNVSLPADFLRSSAWFDSTTLPSFCDVTVGDSEAELPVDILETSEFLSCLFIVLTVLNFTDHTSDVTSKLTISFIHTTS